MAAEQPVSETDELDGLELKLRPKTFSLLKFLHHQAGSIVSKRRIHETVWADVMVTDDSIVQCVAEIRRALRGRDGMTVTTVPRRGYMLTISRTTPPGALRGDVPTVAVLPFINLAGPSEEVFARGLTEDVITELSRHKDIFVIAHHSVLGYRDGIASIERASIELGVRYLLEGSLQWIDDALRVNTRFVDARDHACLWSECYLHPAADLLAAQDEVVAAIVNRIGGSAGVIISVERARLRRGRPRDLEAYHHYVTVSDVDAFFSREGSLAAIAGYERAVERDPGFARAWSRLAAVYLVQVAYTYAEDPEQAAEAYVRAALTAVAIDPYDPFGQALAGGAHFLLGDSGHGEAAFERALALGPNDADTLAAVAYIRPTKLPTAAADLENLRRAMRLNPLYPDWYSLAFGYCGYHAGAYREAIETLQRVDASFLDAQLYLALCYAELGNSAGAARHRERLLALKPDFSTRAVIVADAMCNDAAAAHFSGSAEKARLPP